MHVASEIQIRAWRSFGIGDGKVIEMSQVKHDLKNLVPLVVDESASHENIEWKQDSSTEGMVAFFVGKVMTVYLACVEKDGDDSSSVDEEDDECDNLTEDSTMNADDDIDMSVSRPIEDSSTGFLTFRCNDGQCQKWFRSIDRCESHIISGKHVYSKVKLSPLDTAVHTYESQTDKIGSHSAVAFPMAHIGPQTVDTLRSLGEGWALPQPRSRKRFSAEQITFLVQKYEEGERSGNKWNPAAVALVSGGSLFGHNESFLSGYEDFESCGSSAILT